MHPAIHPAIHPSAHPSIHPSAVDGTPQHLEALVFLMLFVICCSVGAIERFEFSCETIFRQIIKHLFQVSSGSDAQSWALTLIPDLPQERSRHRILICSLATFLFVKICQHFCPCMTSFFFFCFFSFLRQYVLFKEPLSRAMPTGTDGSPRGHQSEKSHQQTVGFEGSLC